MRIYHDVSSMLACHSVDMPESFQNSMAVLSSRHSLCIHTSMIDSVYWNIFFLFVALLSLCKCIMALKAGIIWLGDVLSISEDALFYEIAFECRMQRGGKVFRKHYPSAAKFRKVAECYQPRKHQRRRKLMHPNSLKVLMRKSKTMSSAHLVLLINLPTLPCKLLMQLYTGKDGNALR